jgi:hypothetical protein
VASGTQVTLRRASASTKVQNEKRLPSEIGVLTRWLSEWSDWREGEAFIGLKKIIERKKRFERSSDWMLKNAVSLTYQGRLGKHEWSVPTSRSLVHLHRHDVLIS